jgi:hypothetical protein
MTIRERLLAVYRGEPPDVVPCMLDLSHWFYHKHRLPWDLSEAYTEPERELIDYHRQVGVGFYMPNLAHFFDVRYPGDTQVTVTKSEDGRALTWRIETPLGAIQRTRVWEGRNYAWGMAEWGVKTKRDLRVLAHALGNRTFPPRWDRFKAWDEYVGNVGVVYLPFGYSAMGHLLNYWMGVEAALYAAADWPGTLHEVVDRINGNNLECVDLFCTSPADVVIMGDNFSSDIQPPSFFTEWSRPFYAEASRRLHAAGKRVAVHIDGKLRGALAMIRDAGADCADAVTPGAIGGLSPQQCREEAGPDFLLSGGVSPELWLPTADVGTFRKAVLDWLALRHLSPRLIAAAGDQVPPGAEESRIALMRELVEERGRY